MISGHEERPCGVRPPDTARACGIEAIGVYGAFAVRADEVILAETPNAGCRLDTVGAVGVSHDKMGRHVVSEVYSPPRMTLEIKKGKYRNLASGIALDLAVNDPDDGRP